MYKECKQKNYEIRDTIISSYSNVIKCKPFRGIRSGHSEVFERISTYGISYVLHIKKNIQWNTVS